LQLDPVRAALHRIDPSAAAEVETIRSSIGLAFLPSQVGAVLLGSIGVLGLLLAAIGLYGVMDYSVVRRTRELGIRISVGATRSNISRMVFVECARLIVTGLAIGLFIAFFLTRPLAIFLVPGLKNVDPITFLAVILVTILTGIFAAWGPVRRATAVDPKTALRYE
jgi:ABC-type antimicrobial peptide transport system permease subunit